MKKTFTILIAALMLLTMVATTGEMWGQTREITYEQLTSIANIDESAQYVLGIDDGGFHYSGTSSWGLCALPSAQTPIYYTLTKGANDEFFTAQATIGNATYYLQVPTSNTFSMVETSTQNLENINLIIGTTQISGTNYAVANQGTTNRHLRKNGANGLRSYAGTTGSMAFFYKVVNSSPAYTITAQSNNTNYGTVSLSGTVITGAPNPGYRYANPSYSVDPANSATVVQDGNTFTVTPSANTTITINFEAIPCYTVTLGDDSSTLTELSAGAGVTLPSRNAIGDYSFAGWSPTNVTPETTTAPETIIPAGTYHPTSNITLYPVYTRTEGGGGTSHETASVTISDYATAHNWVSGSNSGPQYTEVILNNDVTATTTGTGNNGKYYSDWRFYQNGNGNIIISTTRGELTSVTFTFTVSNTGTLNYNSSAITSGVAVEVSGTSAEFIVGNSTNATNGQVRITAIAVNYDVTTSGTTYYWSSPVLPTVATPVITPAENPFLFSTTATITCETDGAVIKYRYNENDDWTNYTTSLTITETKTIYAKAVLNENESSVAQVTVTKNLAVPTVTVNGDLIVDLDGETNVNAGTLTATVTYNEVAVDGATVTWSSNNTDVAVIGETTGVVTIKAVGNVTFTATYAGNSDYAEATGTKSITVIDSQAPGTEGNPYTVAQAIDYINTLGNSTSTNDVYVSGIISQVDSYNSTYKSITYWISDDGTTTTQMEVYSGKGLNGADFSAKSDLAVGEIVTVKGKVKKYSGTPEFIQNNQLVFHQVATPTLSPAAGAVALNTTVTISCATTGSTIYYTTNGVDPTTESDVYSAPITIDAVKTIKAFAVKDGMNNSNIATGVYILEPTITVAPAAVNATVSETDGTFIVTLANFTISDPTDLDIQFYDANSQELNDELDWIVFDAFEASNDNYTVDYTIGANDGDARVAYFKVFALNNAEFVYSNLVTINQAEYVAPENKYIRFSGELIEGDYLIVYDGGAMNNTVTSSRLQYEEVTAINNVIATDDNTIIWHIAKSGNYWTIKNKYDNKYAASNGKNKAQMLDAGTADEALWTITGTTTYDFENKARAAGSDPGNKWLRKNSSYGFACYASGTGGALSLYIKNCVLPVTDDELTESAEISEGNITVYDDLTIPSDKEFVLTVSGTLEVQGTLTNTVPSHLIVKEGGQLIIPAAKADPVKATFQREIKGYAITEGKDNYYLIANPTTTELDPEDDVEYMLSNEYDLFYFDESQEGEEWRNYKQDAFNLENRKGYLYANNKAVTLEFAGTVPTGTSANITLSKTDDNTYAGFNLVGNPMSVNITSMNIGGSACSYYKLDSETGVFAVSTDPIIVGEAFMVEAPTNEATLSLNPGAKGENGFNNDVIRLEVSNNKYTDVAYLYFGNHLPLTKINHLNDEAPMLYIHTESANQAVAVMNERSEVKTVNVNFEAKTMGMYTISAKAEKDNFSYMHLYDRLTGIDTDLLISDYTFIGSTTDSKDRFILRFEAVDTDTENEIFAYQSGNNIYVNGEGELQIFDITGRFVMSERINGATSINADALSKGVYVLRIVGSEIKTQKIVVR